MYPSQKLLYKKWRKTRIHYRTMDDHIAYCTRDPVTLEYEIVVSAKYKDSDILMPLLFHEMGHIELGHLGYPTRDQIPAIEELLKKYKVSKEKFVAYYGNVGNFLNICMDLEVNSKFLNKANIDAVNAAIAPGEICTLSGYNVEYKFRFYKYYEDMIKRLVDLPDAEVVTIQVMGDMAANDQESDGDGDDENQSKGKGKGKDSKDKGKGGGFADPRDNPEDGTEEDDENESYGTIQGTIGQKDPDAKQLDKEAQQEERRGSATGTALNNRFRSGESSKQVKRFLESILGHQSNYMIDHMRIYNRQCRGKTNVMYSSVRRKMSKNQVKIGFLIDVSGSMNLESIMTAIQSIDESRINPRSMVLLWDTEEEGRFDIGHIPDSIPNGGGTNNFSEGVQRLVDMGMDEIVVYSDFELYDYGRFANYLKEHNIMINRINVDDRPTGYDEVTKRSLDI